MAGPAACPALSRLTLSGLRNARPLLIYFVSYSLGRGSGAERISDSSDDDKLSQVGPEVILRELRC